LELLPRREHDGTIFMGTVKNESTEVRLSATLKSSGQKDGEMVSFYYADADRKDERYNSGYAIIGVNTGWRTAHDYSKLPHMSVWRLDQPFLAKEGDELIFKLTKGSIGCARFAVTPFAARDVLKSGGNVELAHSLKKWRWQRVSRLYETYLLDTGADAKAF